MDLLRATPYSTFPLYQPRESIVQSPDALPTHDPLLPSPPSRSSREVLREPELPSFTASISRGQQPSVRSEAAFGSSSPVFMRPSQTSLSQRVNRCGSGAKLPGFTLAMDMNSASGPPSTSQTVIVGSITRTTLLKLLENRMGFSKDKRHVSLGDGEPVSGLQGAREMLEKLDTYPLKVPTSREGQERLFSGLTESDLGMFLSLTHFMQRVPYVIPANASLSRTFRLFRLVELPLAPAARSATHECATLDLASWNILALTVLSVTGNWGFTTYSWLMQMSPSSVSSPVRTSPWRRLS